MSTHYFWPEGLTSKLIPLATVQKIISEILTALAENTGTSELTFAKDARDLLIECCVEFVTLISSEANEIAEKEMKKTIAAEHIVKALTDLQFEEYIKEIEEVAVEHKEQTKVSTGTNESI
jgi:histone H3/H4